MSVKLIGEIGINHNGDLKIAEQLIEIASSAGLDYVKFQKRTPDLCVPEHQKSKSKQVPWNNSPISYIDYKRRIEFGKEDYNYINRICKHKGIGWFVSVWDIPSAQFMYEEFHSYIVKIPSAKLTDRQLLMYCRDHFAQRILSTGMSTEDEILEAVDVLKPTVIMHTNSTYPTPTEELNMGYIRWLKKRHPFIDTGYSNHYYGITPAMASVFLGVEWIEIHITLNHEMWGSDQGSSVEPNGLFKFVKGVRDLEKAIESGYGPRVPTDGETEKLKSLRG